MTLHEIFNIKNKDDLIKREKVYNLKESSNNIEFLIDGYQNILELQKINDYIL